MRIKVSNISPCLFLQDFIGIPLDVIKHQIILLEIPRHLQELHGIIVALFSKRQVVSKPPTEIYRIEMASIKCQPCVSMDPSKDHRDQHQINGIVCQLPKLDSVSTTTVHL